jgi:predicted dehydrogenase
VHSGVRETEDLYQRAAATRVVICPDYIQLFHPAFQRVLSIFNTGQLGAMVHIESHLSLGRDLPELRTGRGLHWSYKLPGGILRDYLSHPLSLALYWLGEPKRVIVSSNCHGTLPQGLTDHLAILLEGERCTASVIVSSAIRPASYYLQVFCEQGIVSVNFDTSTVLLMYENALTRSLSRATANFRQAYQLSGWGISNIVNFVRGKLVPYQGLQNLIPRFYSSIYGGSEPPVSRELAIAVTRTEEMVFGGSVASG